MLPDDSVAYIGCVGRDKYADILKETCNKAGIHTEYRVDDVQPTGRCGVIITGHNRSMVTHLAAANEYKIEHLRQPHVWSLVEKAKVYYVGGYHLTVCVPAALALAEEAAKNNKVRNHLNLNVSEEKILSILLHLRIQLFKGLCLVLICTVYPSILQRAARHFDPLYRLPHRQRNGSNLLLGEPWLGNNRYCRDRQEACRTTEEKHSSKICDHYSGHATNYRRGS